MKSILLALQLSLGMLAASAFAADSGRVQVRVDLAHPVLPADKKFTTHLKVGLTGLKPPQEAKPDRPPANVAIVLDRSGSMAGEKIVQAREAAIAAIERLGKDDIVSVIAFDAVTTTVVPATKLTSRDEIIAAIRGIEIAGGTALFAGVSKGAEELRKFKAPHMVSRIVLLSDGQANIGPASADELGRYGMSLAKESISVTTIGLGLGYNDQLMAQLALQSDGNHAFIKEPSELAAVFTEEFGDILSVVAQQMTVKITCPEGVRPVRVLGREASIRSNVVEVAMNQLREGQEKYVLLEVEVPAGFADQHIGQVEVSYRENAAAEPKHMSLSSVASRTRNDTYVEQSANTAILVEVAKQIGVERQTIAVKLSEEGKIKEAEQVFLSNARQLQQQGRLWNSNELVVQGNANVTLNDGNNAGGALWQTYRNAAQTMSVAINNSGASSNINANGTLLNNGQSTLIPLPGTILGPQTPTPANPQIQLILPQGSKLTLPNGTTINRPVLK